MARIAFLGLGVMGYPMAGHLHRAGFDVKVWNRTASKRQDWAKDYAPNAADSIEAAVADRDFVILCVGNDDDVKSVVNQALPFMRPGALIVDHTTASATCANDCFAAAKAKGIGFVDAPISGGESGAQNGVLTIMCGGERVDYDKAEPIMDSYARKVKYVGPSGAGQKTKMVNQICIAGTLQGLSEAINFAMRAGLDVEAVVDAIGKGAAQSWQMDNRAVTMSHDEFDFGFAVDWMRKDLGIAIDAAEKVGADVTMTKQIDGYYKDVQAMGGNRWDTSSLIKRLTVKA